MASNNTFVPKLNLSVVNKPLSDYEKTKIK